MNKRFQHLPKYVHSAGHMSSSKKEDMSQQKFIINIELLTREAGTDIQKAVTMLGQTETSIVDYTMLASRLKTWLDRLIDCDMELGNYRGSKEDVLRCMKLSDDIKQDVTAYEQACTKQAELLHKYYFSKSITDNTKYLNVYNHRFSKDNLRGHKVIRKIPNCMLCPGRRHWMRDCPYSTPQQRRSRLINIGKCQACLVPVWEHGILCNHRAKCRDHPRETHVYWTCDGPRARHPGSQTVILKNITRMQNENRF